MWSPWLPAQSFIILLLIWILVARMLLWTACFIMASGCRSWSVMGYNDNIKNLLPRCHENIVLRRKPEKQYCTYGWKQTGKNKNLDQIKRRIKNCSRSAIGYNYSLSNHPCIYTHLYYKHTYNIFNFLM